jgi:hypothetical protein
MLRAFLHDAYRTTDDAELHVAAKLILNRWGFEAESLPEPSQNERNQVFLSGRKWLTDSRGREYAIVDVPPSDDGPSYRVAIGVNEISVGEVRAFEKAAEARFRMSGADSSPATSLRVSSVTGFCNWCSKQESIPEDQWCYEVSDGSRGSASEVPREGFLRQTGFRLPTKEEWLAAAGGDGSHWLAGCDGTVTERYVWDRHSADMAKRPVGGRLPNPQGLIDLYGNVAEVSLIYSRFAAGRRDDVYCQMGGSVLSDLKDFKSDASQGYVDVRIIDSYVGFRLARTLPAVEAPSKQAFYPSAQASGR